MTAVAGAAGVREWWIRTALVLQSPRPVFVALRQETEENTAARSEPVLLVVLLAGIAFVLSTQTAGRLMEDHQYDGLLVAVWAFLAGGLYGGIAFWLIGAILHGALAALGSHGTYRRSRHILAFSAVPVALSLILWPVKIALYGDALFLRGGADAGTGGKVFEALGLGFAAWAGALLVIGIRSVHGWGWARSLAAAAVPLAAGASIVLF